MKNSIEITPEQRTMWDDTRVSLLRHCPAFSHLFYSLLINADEKNMAVFTDEIPIAATDGRNLLFNPKTFFNYSLNERVFIVGHEILHCMFNHPALFYNCHRQEKVVYPSGSELPYVVALMQWSADYVVNAILIEGQVGKYQKGWLYDPKLATAKDSVLDVYAKMYKNALKPNGDPFDEHLEPGWAEDMLPWEAMEKRSEQQWQSEIRTAMEVAKMKGDFPGSLERVFDTSTKPIIDWRDQLKSYFARRIGSGSYNWRMPDRRFITRGIYAPARSGFDAGTIVVAVDTSGSISSVELNRFMAEISGILEEVKPRELFVIWCDAAVHGKEEITDLADLKNITAKGGGGTAFEPVFEFLEKEGIRPDPLIYLTDGMGSFPPHAPEYDVVWGSTTAGYRYPFGHVVDLPMGNARDT